MSDYTETATYWNKVFAEEVEYNPFKELPYPKIEKAVRWLSTNTNSVIDFGCGDGRLLSRCLEHDVKQILGIDLSKKAVSEAREIMGKYNLDGKSNFMVGGSSKLKEIDDNEFDAAILSNIIDNMKPEDAEKVIKEISRILKIEGKVMLKLNPYFDPADLIADKDYQEISADFYKEKSGLYLWNISEELLEEIFSPYFKIVHYGEIVFEEYNMINRLYYLRNC